MPSTEKYAFIKKQLIALTIGHFFLAILYFIGGLSSLFKGFGELLCATITIIAICTYHYCALAFYTLLLLINFVWAFVKVGISIQHNTLYDWDKYFFVVALLSGIFYLFAMCISLYAYKEFKYVQLYGSNVEFEIDVNKPYYLSAEQSPGVHGSSQTKDFPGASVTLE